MRRFLLFGIGMLAFSLSGCGLFPPMDGNKPDDTDEDEETNVDVEDKHGIAPKIVKALVKDEASYSDCRLMWAAFESMAEYVENGHNGITSSGQAIKLWSKYCDNLGWKKGKYEEFSEAVKEAFDEYGLDEPKPMDEVADKVEDTFRVLAAGCKEAALKVKNKK